MKQFYIVCVKRQGMSFYAQNSTTGRHSTSLAAYLMVSEVQRFIENCKKFNDQWEICIIPENENDEMKVVLKGENK